MIVVLLQGMICAVGSTVVTNTDPAGFSEAVQAGGLVTLAFDGTVMLNDTLTISQDTTLDASGRSVRLDGDNLIRHFVVTNSATLRLIKLTLVNGLFRGRDGQVQAGAQDGETAQGGSIFNAGGTLELLNCQFINNQVRGGDGANLVIGPRDGGKAYGGAICSVEGVVSATNCVFAGSQCTGGNGSLGTWNSFGGGGDAFGGALYVTNSRISLDGVVLTNNVTRGGEINPVKSGRGGGSALGGAVALELGSGALSNVITRCVFAENRAFAATRSWTDMARSFSDGGALFCGSGALTIQESLFSQNVALGGLGFGYPWDMPCGDGRGGAVFNRGGELTIQDSAIVFNQAIRRSIPQYWDCIMCGGEAGNGWGGAIFNHGTLSVRNSTLAGNAALGGAGYWQARAGSSYGGAVFNEGSVSLLNVTMADNDAVPGGAIGVISQEPPPQERGDTLATESGIVALMNTILFSVQGKTNVWGAVHDGGHNICSDPSAAFTATSSSNTTDPLLGSLGNNGGLTPTIPLLPASPAIDAGNDAAAPATDQRGVTRQKGVASDIGAFELSPTLRLAAGEPGRMKVEYLFKASETNQFSASTALAIWLPLGLKVADTNGVTAVEEVDLDELPTRFYKAEPTNSGSGH